MIENTDSTLDANGCSISVVTATFNSEDDLPGLIDSLIKQTDRDFVWVVQDGGSTDGTSNLLDEARESGLNVIVSSAPDFGIYDALNKALKRLTTSYYVTAGSDDVFSPEAIAQYRKAILAHGAPFVVANIISQGKVMKPKGGSLIVNRQWVFSAGHALGTLIKKEMHEKYGYYSNKFPIAADQYFLMKAYLGGETFFSIDVVAGTFGEDGLSSTDTLGTMTESMRIQTQLLGKPLINLLIFVLRFVKNLGKVG